VPRHLKAGVEADFAASVAVKELALKQAQIDNYAADQEIARKNLKINKLNADLKREENKLKKQDLEQKIETAKLERDEKLRTKVADANNVYANFDNFLNTADRALQGWSRTKDGKVDISKPKGYVESATGPISTRLPTLSQDTADFEELIETSWISGFPVPGGQDAWPWSADRTRRRSPSRIAYQSQSYARVQSVLARTFSRLKD
jgi:hypothetical protein